MLIYHFHPDTGEYLGEGIADESPREPGVYLMPAHSTASKPKAPREGYVVVFRNGKWGYVRASAPSDEATDDPPPSEAYRRRFDPTLRGIIEVATALGIDVIVRAKKNEAA